MMGHQQVEQAALFYEFSLERHVPSNHLLRSIDRFVELSEVRRELSAFYSTIGRPSIAPELMIRMLLVGYCFGIRSERRLCEEGPPEPGVSLVLSPRARWRGARPLPLFQDAPRPVPRRRPAARAVRDGGSALHG